MRPVRAVSDLVYCVKGSSFRFDSVHRYGAFQESNRKSNSNQDIVNFKSELNQTKTK